MESLGEIVTLLYLDTAGKIRVVYSARAALRAICRARVPMKCKRVDNGAIVGEADGKGGYTFNATAAEYDPLRATHGKNGLPELPAVRT